MPTLAQIILAPQTSRNAATLEAPAYAEDAKQLAANDGFRAMMAEIPSTYNYPETIGPWELSRILNSEARTRGLHFQFIGTPYQAAKMLLEEDAAAQEPTPDRKEIERQVREHPEFLYLSRPGDGQSRYVFQNKICLSLGEAHAYALTTPARSTR